MPIEVNVTNQEIEVSTSGQTVNATVGGGVGPAGPAGPEGPAGSNGSEGPPGVVSANAPISYDAENQAVGWTSFSNGTSLNIGTFDTEIGGYGGISLFCAVGYELNWQAGYLRAVNGDGSTRNIWVESPLEFPGEGTDNVQIDAAGITFADGSQQTVAFTGDASTLVGGDDELSLDGAGAITFTHSPGGGALEFPQSTGGIARIVAPSTQGLGIYSGNNAEPVYIYTVDNKSLGGVYVGTVDFPDKTTQTTAWLGSVDWNDVNNKPTFFDGAYSSLTGLPTLGTAASANTGDFAAASHNHAWSDITSGVPSTFTPSAHNHAASEITSGTLDIARLPVGTGSTQVAAGDHTHAQLHDRSHAITSSSDHTATAWRAFYSNGSGVITEIVLGAANTVLTSNGASAAPTFSGISSSAVSGLAAIATSGSASDLSTGTVGTARLGSGTANSTTFLRGDGTWAAAGSTNASDLTSGTLAYARMADPTVTSPSQIAANQNNYASFARGINRFTTNAARDITGMVAGNDGEVRVLCNVGTTAANTLTIKDESSSSTAANRFSVPWNGDCIIPAEGSVVVFYDGTSSRWRVI